MDSFSIFIPESITEARVQQIITNNIWPKRRSIEYAIPCRGATNGGKEYQDFGCPDGCQSARVVTNTTYAGWQGGIAEHNGTRYLPSLAKGSEVLLWAGQETAKVYIAWKGYKCTLHGQSDYDNGRGLIVTVRIELEYGA